MVECAEAREAWKQKIFKEKAQNRYYCYATSVPTLMKIHPGRPNITHCYKTRISASKLNLICSSRKPPKIGVDVIPKQIWKPELSHLFSKLRIPSILEVLELFQWKAEFSESLGFQCLQQIKLKVLLLIEKIPELWRFCSGFPISPSSGIKPSSNESKIYIPQSIHVLQYVS